MYAHTHMLAFDGDKLVDSHFELFPYSGVARQIQTGQETLLCVYLVINTHTNTHTLVLGHSYMVKAVDGGGVWGRPDDDGN